MWEGGEEEGGSGSLHMNARIYATQLLPTLPSSHSHPPPLTIVVHNLCAPQLFIGGVHLSPEHFVQCSCPRQDNVRVLYLDHTLAKTQQVRTNPNSTTGHLQGECAVVYTGLCVCVQSCDCQVIHYEYHVDGEHLLVGPGRLPCNHT